jgi:hypothetical protein
MVDSSSRHVDCEVQWPPRKTLALCGLTALMCFPVPTHRHKFERATGILSGEPLVGIVGVLRPEDLLQICQLIIRHYNGHVGHNEQGLIAAGMKEGRKYMSDQDDNGET